MPRKGKKLPVSVVTLVMCLLCYGLGRIYYRLTDDFSLKNITHDFAYNEKWDIPLPQPAEKESILKILNQKFTYIGKGAQAFAFMGEDGRYVIKVFKFKHLKPNPLLSYLPDIEPFNRIKTADKIRKDRKFNTVFTGYKLAFDFHRKETGIIYAHINQTQGVWNSMCVKDKLGFTRKLDLDRIPFVIQDCAIKTRDLLQTLLDAKDVGAAKVCIRKVIDLYQNEYSKGLHDRDHGVMHNTGFVGDRIIHLDVGKFVKDDTMRVADVNKLDLIGVLWKFSIWVEKNYPVFHKEILDDMEEKMSAIYHEKITITKPLYGKL